ncbi:hypothetical protein ACRDNQ_02920 [Palleronia sp. KMU-117]|uniref:hypothetical protein n=1 Tax=Palleronia sp. KMU-117 TaxID=3434108 RepID=UPI003D7389DC
MPGWAALLCGTVTVLILAAMAVAFWRDPDDGLRQTSHRIELLPRVMADRYTAFAILALVLTLHGDLAVLAAFFAVCAFMGFADGLIYARAGHPHGKHTLSGVLSTGALAITLAALATGGSA